MFRAALPALEVVVLDSVRPSAGPWAMTEHSTRSGGKEAALPSAAVRLCWVP